MDRAMHQHGGFAVACRLHGVIEHLVRGFVLTDIIEHSIITLGEPGIVEHFKAELHLERGMYKLADIGGKIGCLCRVIVVAATGNIEHLERSLSRRRGVCRERTARRQQQER